METVCPQAFRAEKRARRDAHLGPQAAAQSENALVCGAHPGLQVAAYTTKRSIAISTRTAIDRIYAYIKTTYLLSRDYNEREEAAFTATSRFVSPFTGRKRVLIGRDSRLIMKRIAAYKG